VSDIFNTEGRIHFFRVTFEFIEKVRKTFAEADTDNTGYLDVSEFTAFMRRTYPDITNREAQIIFMKVDILFFKSIFRSLSFLFYIR
jgi:Ca2+-binding EF-hand superfamily protein